MGKPINPNSGDKPISRKPKPKTDTARQYPMPNLDANKPGTEFKWKSNSGYGRMADDVWSTLPRPSRRRNPKV